MRTLCGLVLPAAILCLGAAIATSRVTAAEIYASRVFSADQDAIHLADGMAGMWAFGPPDDVDATPDVMHLICSTSPYIIHLDGLVEYLAGGEDELLEPRQFMRCKADMTCDVFEGAPHSLAADPLDKATFKLADGKGTLCMASDPDNCQTLRKCTKLEWDDAARASGHAEQWEKLFAASAN